MKVHSSRWKPVYKCNQSSAPEKNYFITSKGQQNEKPTQNMMTWFYLVESVYLGGSVLYFIVFHNVIML